MEIMKKDVWEVVGTVRINRTDVQQPFTSWGKYLKIQIKELCLWLMPQYIFNNINREATLHKFESKCLILGQNILKTLRGTYQTLHQQPSRKETEGEEVIQSLEGTMKTCLVPTTVSAQEMLKLQHIRYVHIKFIQIAYRNVLIKAGKTACIRK